VIAESNARIQSSVSLHHSNTVPVLLHGGAGEGAGPGGRDGGRADAAATPLTRDFYRDMAKYVQLNGCLRGMCNVSAPE